MKPLGIHNGDFKEVWEDVNLGDFSLTANGLQLVTVGYELEEWTAKSYDVDDDVRHNGFNYICIEAAGPTDEPGIATDKWEEDGLESLASPAILYNNSDSPNSLLNTYNPDSKELFFIGLNENGIDFGAQYFFVGDFRMFGNSFVAGTDISSLYDSKPETYIKTLINIGNNINATENGLAIGQNITTDYGFAFGIDINTTGSAAFGAFVTGNGAVALGFIIDASNRGSALGRQITFDGEQDVGAGVNLTVTGDYSIAIGNDITVTGDKSLCIGYGNSVLANNSSLIGGSGNCNNGDYSSMSGGQNNECDGTNSFVAGGSGNEATGNYTSAISSMDCMVSGLQSSSFNCRYTQIYGDGAIGVSSNNCLLDGYGSFIAVSEECLANSYGAVIVNSIYSSVTGFGSSIYNSTAVNVGAVWSMAIDSVYLEVEDLTFFNFATNTINSVIRDPLAGLPIPNWADETPYIAGDYVRSNANFFSTNFGYVCIQSHTSTEATRPESGENWADYWQLFTSARSIILGGDDIDITGAYNSNFNGIGNTIGGNFNYSFGSGNTIVGDRNMLINLRAEALTQIGDETLLLNGTLQVNTGPDSYIKSDELFVDIGDLLEDYAWYIPIIETKAHETSEVLGLNYATGLYDRLGIFDKSDTDRVGIIFSKQDLFLTSPVGQIDYHISEDRFEIIGDWCPDSVDYEDEIYRSLGQNTLKWKDLFVRDKIKIGDTELTEADLIALKALL